MPLAALAQEDLGPTTMANPHRKYINQHSVDDGRYLYTLHRKDIELHNSDST
jgi:hypothetical protein